MKSVDFEKIYNFFVLNFLLEVVKMLQTKIMAHSDLRVFWTFASQFNTIRAKSHGSGMEDKKIRPVAPVNAQFF